MLMETNLFFTSEEKTELFSLYRKLIVSAGDSVGKGEIDKVKKYLIAATQKECLTRDVLVEIRCSAVCRQLLSFPMKSA